MANTGFLDVSELSFDGIKSNLKTFLQAKSEYTDYDFEGSNLSALLDVLSYNTYMNNYYLNMIGSEMFLDSSELKESAVSHAKELNYLPRSRTSARVQIQFSIAANDRPQTIIIPEDYAITTTIDNKLYKFSIEDNLVVTRNAQGQYISESVYLYEGSIVNEFFTVSTGKTFKLNNTNIDTNSIKVNVTESSGDSTNTFYTFAENLQGLNANSKVYFLQGYNSDQYEVVFGDGVFGKALTNGNIVRVKYRSTNGDAGNKAKTFTSTTKAQGYTVTTSVITPAADGSERETLASIKLNAPRFFTTQNRAVTREDYINLVLSEFPQVQACTVYGGEDVDPPQFGKVIVTLKPYGSNPILSDTVKESITKYLRTKNITTEPIIQDPEYIYLEVTTDVRYNPDATTKSIGQLKTDTINQIKTFNNTNFTEFGNDFRKSQLITNIDETNLSIVSNDTSIRMVYKIAPIIATNQSFDFSFGNPIYNSSQQFKYPDGFVESVQSSFFSYEKNNTIYSARISDDGKGILRLYYVSTNDSVVELNDNIGTVNYSTGRIKFTINVYDYIQTIDIYAKPARADVVVKENKFLEIDFSKINVTVAPYRS